MTRVVTRRVIPQSDGREERDEAIRRVTQNADVSWRTAAQETCRVLAAEQPEFTTDAIWDRLSRRYPAATTHERRALGGVMTWAAREGIVVATDRYEESDRPEAHRNPKKVWQSLTYREREPSTYTSTGARVARRPRTLLNPLPAPPVTDKDVRKYVPPRRVRVGTTAWKEQQEAAAMAARAKVARYKATHASD